MSSLWYFQKPLNKQYWNMCHSCLSSTKALTLGGALENLMYRIFHCLWRHQTRRLRTLLGDFGNLMNMFSLWYFQKAFKQATLKHVPQLFLNLINKRLHAPWRQNEESYTNFDTYCTRRFTQRGRVQHPNQAKLKLVSRPTCYKAIPPLNVCILQRHKSPWVHVMSTCQPTSLFHDFVR